MLPYLQDSERSSYNVELDICLRSATMASDHKIATSNMKYLYYSVP